LLSRRSLVAASAELSLAQRLHAADTAMKGGVNHSVCKWCYAKVPLEDRCKQPLPGSAPDTRLAMLAVLGVPAPTEMTGRDLSES